MKIIYVTAFLLLFTSCSLFTSTTIEVINNSERPETVYQQLNGSLWEPVVFCFRGDDVVDEIKLDPIRTDGGTSGIIEVDNEIEKVKVSFKFVPDDSELADQIDNDRRYTVSYTYIEKNEHNIIYIDYDTFLSGSLTKSTQVKLLDLFNAENPNK